MRRRLRRGPRGAAAAGLAACACAALGLAPVARGQPGWIERLEARAWATPEGAAERRARDLAALELRRREATLGPAWELEHRLGLPFGAAPHWSGTVRLTVPLRDEAARVARDRAVLELERARLEAEQTHAASVRDALATAALLQAARRRVAVLERLARETAGYRSWLEHPERAPTARRPDALAVALLLAALPRERRELTDRAAALPPGAGTPAGPLPPPWPATGRSSALPEPSTCAARAPAVQRAWLAVRSRSLARAAARAASSPTLRLRFESGADLLGTGAADAATAEVGVAGVGQAGAASLTSRARLALRLSVELPPWHAASGSQALDLASDGIEHVVRVRWPNPYPEPPPAADPAPPDPAPPDPAPPDPAPPDPPPPDPPRSLPARPGVTQPGVARPGVARPDPPPPPEVQTAARSALADLARLATAAREARTRAALLAAVTAHPDGAAGHPLADARLRAERALQRSEALGLWDLLVLDARVACGVRPLWPPTPR